MLQLTQELLLLITPSLRPLQAEGEQQITAAAATGPSLAFESKTAARRCTGRNGHIRFAVRRHHRDRATERQFIQGDGQIGTHLIPLQAPNGMSLNLQVEIQITATPGTGLQIAFALQTQA